MRYIGCLFAVLVVNVAAAQSPWPSENWASATPLTAVMSNSGLLELSGLHWNPVSKRLYVVHGDGRLRVMEFNTASNTFSQIGNKSISGGPEGITQANFSANEFYTIDENNYEIRKYTHTANFSTVTESRHWDLLQSPSPMQDTGNTGPEGIVFVPDAHLSAIGFTSSETNQTYTSTKGAGGLFFVAHQDGGYIWVFDINPNVNNDFAYVGKYQTSRSESCDLSFDRSTGMLYILHNTGANYIEVTDLTLAPVSSTKFTTISEYFMANPTDGNINLEGFAIMPKCESLPTGGAFVCRDVESDEATSIKQDAIRWFDPYVAAGDCPPLQIEVFTDVTFAVYPNPATNQMTVDFKTDVKKTVHVYNPLGQLVFSQHTAARQLVVETTGWASGVYLIEIQTENKTYSGKVLKN